MTKNILITSVVIIIALAYILMPNRDSLAMEREETIRLQIHETALIQRHAMTVCANNSDACKNAPTIPNERTGILQRLGTIAITISGLVTLVLLGILLLAWVGSKRRAQPEKQPNDLVQPPATVIPQTQ